MDLTRRADPPLGDLERAVLELLWARGEADVTEVHRALGAKRGISANTVGSALERLFRKRFAARIKVSHAYRYSPAISREQFMARRIVATAGDFRLLAASGFLASFVDVVAEADRQALDELQDLIARKRKEAE